MVFILAPYGSHPESHNPRPPCGHRSAGHHLGVDGTWLRTHVREAHQRTTRPPGMHLFRGAQAKCEYHPGNLRRHGAALHPGHHHRGLACQKRAGSVPQMPGLQALQPQLPPAPACVRCGEPHFAGKCPRPRDETPTCANCGGLHPANHRSCPTFRREARNTGAGTLAFTDPANTEVSSKKKPRCSRKRKGAARPQPPQVSSASAPATAAAPTTTARARSPGRPARSTGPPKPTQAPASDSDTARPAKQLEEILQLLAAKSS